MPDLSGHLTLGNLLSLTSRTGIIDGLLCPPGIYMGSRDPNASCHSCMAHTLTSEPQPQPTYAYIEIPLYSNSNTTLMDNEYIMHSLKSALTSPLPQKTTVVHLFYPQQRTAGREHREPDQRRTEEIPTRPCQLLRSISTEWGRRQQEPKGRGSRQSAGCLVILTF